MLLTARPAPRAFWRPLSLALAVGLCLCALLARPAAAADDPKALLAQFKQAYAAANEAFEKKDYAQALPNYEKAAEALGRFEENDKLGPFVEDCMMKLAECHSGLYRAEPANNEHFNSAKKQFELLLKRKKLYELSKDDISLRLAGLSFSKSRSFADTGNFREAEKFEMEGLALIKTIKKQESVEETLAREYSWLGKVYKYVGKYKEALATLDFSLKYWEKTNNQKELIREKGLANSIKMDMGRVGEAENDYARLIAELNAADQAESLFNVEFHVNKAVCAIILGKYKQAAELLDKAERIAAKLPEFKGKDAIVNNRGIIAFREGLYYDGIALFTEAAKTLNQQLKAQALGNMGGVYLNLYRGSDENFLFNKGEASLSQAIKLASDVNDVRTLMAAGSNLGKLYTLRAQRQRQTAPEQATEDYNNAMDRLFSANALAAEYEKSNIPTPEYADISNHLGDLYLSLNNRKDKSPLKNQTLCPGGGLLACAERSFYQASQTAARINSPEDLWYAYYGLARTAKAGGNPAKAVEYYKKAIDIIEGMRNLVGGKAAVGFFHDKHSAYNELIDLLLDEWSHAADQARRKELSLQALEYLEKSRLNELKALFEQALPEDKQAAAGELGELNYRLAVLSLEEKKNLAEIQGIRKLLPNLEKTLEKDDPFLKRPALPLQAVQQKLAPERLVLEFYYNASMIYIWKIDKTSVTLHAANRFTADEFDEDKKIDFFTQYVDDFCKYIDKVHEGEGRKKKVVDDLLEFYKRFFVDSKLGLDQSKYASLSIIPYKKISILPFAAFIADKQTNATLGQKYRIHTVSSLNQLLLDANKSEAGFFGVGNPNMPGAVTGDPDSSKRGESQATAALAAPEIQRIRSELLGALAQESGPTRSAPSVNFSQLPDAGAEVNDIAGIIGQQGGGQSKLLVNSPTPLRGVIADLQQTPYAYLHLATHGKLLSKAPLLSFLAFSEDQQETDPNMRNGYFTVKMIREHLFGRLKNTQLCVLSACQTALIGEVDGLEFASLAGAFQSAGVRAILATLWEVPSKQTADMMRAFYGHLFSQSGPRNYAEALRFAQEKIRATYEDPFYWAPFIVLGPES